MKTDDLKQRANDLLVKMQPGKLEDNKAIVAELKELYQQSLNEDIAFIYASGLLYLIFEQDLSGRDSSISELKQVYSSFSDNKVIAFIYAIGLFNLSAKQDLSGRELSVSQLKQVYSSFSDNEAIAFEYAKGLFNLTEEQDLTKSEGSLRELSRLKESFSNSDGLRVLYISGVLNVLRKNSFDSVNDIEKYKKDIADFLSASGNEYKEQWKSNFSEDVLESVFIGQENWEIFTEFLTLFSEDNVAISPYLDCFEWKKELDKDNIQILYQLKRLVKLILQKLTIDNLSDEKYKRIGHYTGVEVLKALLSIDKDENKPVLKFGHSRFNNANYMNDTQEGELLDDFLKWKNETGQLKASHWYLMSLTANIDNLTMWSQYGKQGEGVAIVFNKDTFSIKTKMSQHNLIPLQKLGDNEEQEEQEGEEVKTENRVGYTPYRICYIKGRELVGDLFEKNELKDIKNYLREIEKLLSELGSNKLNKYIHNILEEIRYLFKSADYLYESEIRLLQYVSYAEKDRIQLTDDELPKLYVNSEFPVRIKEVIFGPKVIDAINFAPYISYFDEDIIVTQSQINFR